MVVGLVCALIIILKWEDLWGPIVFVEVVFCFSSVVCLLYWGFGYFAHREPNVVVSSHFFVFFVAGGGLFLRAHGIFARVFGFLTSIPILCLKEGCVCFESPWHLCEVAYIFDLRSRPLS